MNPVVGRFGTNYELNSNKGTAGYLRFASSLQLDVPCTHRRTAGDPVFSADCPTLRTVCHTTLSWGATRRFRRPAKMSFSQSQTVRKFSHARWHCLDKLKLKSKQLSCQHKNANLTLISCTKCMRDPFFGIRGWKNTKNLTKKPPQWLEIADKLASSRGQCVDCLHKH